MRRLLVIAAFISMPALGQDGDPAQYHEETGFDAGDSVLFSGPNWTSFERFDFFENGHFFVHGIDYRWVSTDGDDEPIDEIVVKAKRRVRSGTGGDLQMFGYLSLGDLLGRQVCAIYTDFGHCSAYKTVWEEDLIPLSPSCQTVSGQTAPLTQFEADEMNVAAINTQNAENTVASITIGIGLGILSGGTSMPTYVSALLGTGGALALGIAGHTEGLPFAAGDVVTYSLTACNDGNGGVNATMSISTN